MYGSVPLAKRMYQASPHLLKGGWVVGWVVGWVGGWGGGVRDATR